MKSPKLIGRMLIFLLLASLTGCKLPECPEKLPNGSVRTMQERRQRQWTSSQIEELRAFALRESPLLWKTIVELQAECRTREISLRNLCDEMRGFGRDPESDVDCVKLQRECDDIKETINGVFVRLEEAYITYKKFEARPGEKDYSEIIHKSLEEGIQEAELAERRYRDMSKIK